MSKKFIDVMDTTFRDGFQSVFGARVAMKDFLPAVSAAKEAGIRHFEFGGGARFQSLYFYLNEDAFAMMDKFRETVGDEANLQTLARGVNTVTLDTGSREMIDMHAKLFAKHGTTTIRNFDALNDVENLKYSGERIKAHGLKHEITVTMMDLPPRCSGAHDPEFYAGILRKILEAGIPFDSVCFKDASGTSSPQKVFETIRRARKLLGNDIHIRLHTHETAGVSVACYQAALAAGVDGIDLAAYPVSGGTSQPDILTILHATKGQNFDFGFDAEKILKYEEVLEDCLKDYFLPPEATMVSPIIPFSPMPGGALTANTQMMRDNKIMDKFPSVIKAMREVVEKGGYGTSVTPVSQFYFQQAFNNVMFGEWKKIAEGYGKMVLGYFGKTPVAPDSEVVRLASEQLGLEPTTKNAVDLADLDETKSIAYAKKQLEDENIEPSEENIFIALACREKGIAFLKGEGKVMIRKNEAKESSEGSEKKAKSDKFDINVNGKAYAVEFSGNKVLVNGDSYNVSIGAPEPSEAKTEAKSTANSDDIVASLPSNVFKILVKPGEKVVAGQTVVVLEAMKMEINIESPRDGEVAEILVFQGQSVDADDPLIHLK
ncbi:biotin attachment protein [Campylobacter sp. VBCF_05 NA6]|uniref:biotin/lipoyl-containing protein n=1 Tax=unclassified Campylobacter TaxID=2593542 RepID=UPI0022E9A3D5|nr:MULTISPECIES: biotin/lipoyl-containing protein [unclassified Campylobacter]MDA3057293.1 biotin attachment protein [Campylobacter sp. VBCF_04 NA7]MDA3059135.1 biotin attachment protein [Campylobacter sp. VBCF_05 NA6]